jgi:tRNA nucleotidyltransferase (CCA-adding enzyme)
VSDKDSESTGLTIITTHINADFDALASMLAAQKLYPDSLVVFPGSQDRNLQHFFIKSMVYLFNMVDFKKIDVSRIRRLVVVDTKNPGRIGDLAEILDRPDLDIHLYDHHPASSDDMHGSLEVTEKTGANVTILTERIRELNIPLSADEATVLCLGIYEDTGSFTFNSTTERDLLAAAYLLSQGANLGVISTLITREINSDQVGLLNDIVQSSNHYPINGVDIVLTTVTRDQFIPDFAFLVHKLVSMENIAVVFAIALMENKIHVVARSRIEEVDVGEILREFGGGGHAYAASAVIRDQTLPQFEHRLLDVLYRKVRHNRLARHLMSAPAITAPETLTIKEAADMLTRYNINALVIIGPDPTAGMPAGFITRQVVEKALYHQLGEVPVKDYMRTDIVTVSPDAPLIEIQEKIIGHKQRLLPVVGDGVLMGVVTRTDLLNILASDVRTMDQRDPLKSVNPRTRNIENFLMERLPPRIIQILRDIGQASEKLGVTAYVVGGFVRDLFLYRPNEDVDIVIEGDGIAFAKSYGKSVNARVHTYSKFGTAVITYPDGFKVDVASARIEYYRFPADLPTVEMSSIKLDLFRRDFTINTLAICLVPDRFGILIDFFFARRDLKEKAIRVLHNLSFVEDPTRIFRAIRFEQRFGFRIGKLTSGLIENAVKMDSFKRLSGHRIFTELKLIFQEENPYPTVKRMDEYGLLKIIHPSIELTQELLEDFESVRKVLAWYDLLFLGDSYMKWAVYFLALIRSADAATVLDICRRLELPPRLLNLFGKGRREAEYSLGWMERRLPLKNSRIYDRLSPMATELILYIMAISSKETIKRYISQYFTSLRFIQISITGRDLQQMQVPPGPVYRRLMNAVHRAKLDDEVKTKEEEIAYAKAFLEGENGSAATGEIL